MESVDRKGSGSGTAGSGMSTNTHGTPGAGYTGGSGYTYTEIGLVSASASRLPGDRTGV